MPRWFIPFLLITAGATARDGPLTVAESSGYRATSTSAQVEEFLTRVAKSADHVRTLEFGRTVEGRPLTVALAASPAVTSPAELTGDPRLVVLIIGNIHSGECAGKEALLRMLREVGPRPGHEWLKELVLLLVPNYNADANDRMSTDNRPGQLGPSEGMGERANAQGLDLNRDYMKLETPEARALVGLMNRWRPDVFIDCHTTDGSWHRDLLSYDTQHHPAADTSLGEYMRHQMMPRVAARLERKGVPTVYYGNFQGRYDRWYTYGHWPRFGLDYYALRGRISILSEAYAHATYRQRIEVTHAFVGECLTYLARERPEISQLLESVDRRANRLVPLRAAVAPFDQPITIRGYDPPDAAGKPKDLQVEYWARFIPTWTVRPPYAYLIPPGLDSVAGKLRQHGIELEQLKQDVTAEVEVYRWVRFQHAERLFQKHRLARAEVRGRKERRTLRAGSHVARTAQPLGTLLICLLEPASDDGLVTWNFFDDMFEEGGDYPVLRLTGPVTP